MACCEVLFSLYQRGFNGNDVDDDDDDDDGYNEEAGEQEDDKQ